MNTHPQQGTVSDKDVARLRERGGRWLKILRENAGLSQRQVANAVGIEFYTFISQLESGRGRIPPERYAAFAKAFRMDKKEFVRELLRYYDPATYKALFED